MKIAEASVQLASQHHAVEHHEVRESLVFWKDTPGQVSATNPAIQQPPLDGTAGSVKISLSAEALAASVRPAEAVDETDELDGDAMFDLKFNMLRLLIEKLTGREIKLLGPADLRGEGKTPPDSPIPSGPDQTAAPVREGWGLAYDFQETRYEMEATRFTAGGTIHTSDGRRLDFSVELNMSREFLQTSQFQLRAGDALKDPLVLNFNGTGAELAQTTFAFDLDLDGQDDAMPFLRPGSGFLALDQNSDGRINDGRELFGPRTGNGFAELAAYDEDGNGWIDENDAIFSKLLIWERCPKGNDMLTSLVDRGVGAIYLGSVDTPFALKDSNQALQGAIRSSGVFLYENGGVGTVQQLDLVV